MDINTECIQRGFNFEQGVSESTTTMVSLLQHPVAKEVLETPRGKPLLSRDDSAAFASGMEGAGCCARMLGIARDIDLAAMDFDPRGVWYSGAIGFSFMQ